MNTELIDLRAAAPTDCEALAAIHSEAWLVAYRGVLNGVELQRLVGRRGAAWWHAALARGVQIKVLEVAEEAAGYATFGPCRLKGLVAEGEIYEIYLKPEYQGLGFGRTLFDAVRRDLSDRRLEGLAVQVLSENEAARQFYRAIGGQLSAKSWYRSAGKRFELSIYTWQPTGTS